MLTEVTIDHKQNVIGDSHGFDHGQEPDIGLAKPGSAADNINDQMG